MGQVWYTVDISDAMRELRRLDDPPGFSGLLRLEAVLAAQFQATQQAVHVITGSLRATGDPDSNVRNHTWRGEIGYGGVPAPGVAPGPARYVNYARYEQERAGVHVVDGTPHDFMAPARALEAAYTEAILAYLRGDA